MVPAIKNCMTHHFLFIVLMLAFPFQDYHPGVLADSNIRIPDHAIWSAELEKYVSEDGLVNYTLWGENQANLDKYLRQVSKPLPLSNWSQNVQLAYWINIYNAYTIKLVLQHYPIESITDLYDGQPKNEPWIVIGEDHFSLQQIEDEIRRQFNDPRAHFALNHATKTSAPLLHEAYLPDRMDHQLNEQTECFLNNPAYNQIHGSRALLSPIFHLYEVDFKPDIPTYLKKYFPSLTEKKLKIEFFEVDVSINDLHAAE